MEIDDLSDQQLLKLSRSGNEEAFMVLYKRRHPVVYRFAVHMSGSREIAEEVVQEVFLALLEGGDYSPDKGCLEGFLIGMARNQVRRISRRSTVAEGKQLALEATAPDDLCAGLCKEGDLEALRQAILALPEAYRAVTVLCDLEELSYSEAAQRLGCAVGTVRSRLHRARSILELKMRRRNQCPIPTAR